jgi:hypothetical protein
MPFVMNLLGNVVANVVAWVLLGLTFWLGSRRTRARFASFFGVQGPAHVTVFLSNLWNPETRPAFSRQSAGYVISKHELRAARSIDSLLGGSPARLPELVRGLVDALWLRSRIRCRIEVSPLVVDEVEPAASLVVVGASHRNSVRRHYLERGLPSAVMFHEAPDVDKSRYDDMHEVRIRRSSGDSQVVRSALSLAVVERVYAADQGRTIFFCLGVRADATWGATEYLARNWKDLAREFRTNQFVVCLGFPRVDPYFEEYPEPTVLARMRP